MQSHIILISYPIIILISVSYRGRDGAVNIWFILLVLRSLYSIFLLNNIFLPFYPSLSYINIYIQYYIYISIFSSHLSLPLSIEDQIAVLLAQMIQGLIYLHSHKILHRDIKVIILLLYLYQYQYRSIRNIHISFHPIYLYIYNLITIIRLVMFYSRARGERNWRILEYQPN